MSRLKTIEWINNAARIIDQTVLPTELTYEDILSAESMWDAIKKLKIRGAPAIGIAAAYGLYLGIRALAEALSREEFLKQLDEKAAYLASSRPTAVNLFWALDRMKKTAHDAPVTSSVADLKSILFKEAYKILTEDEFMCRKIGEYGFEILKGFNSILTHCNAGGLATSGYGTALAPIYIGSERGKRFHVYADETRPLLQGSRITAFELMAAHIPVTLICDNMACMVMSQKKIDAVIVGADRIAANGDTANKIGTYGVATLARAHGIPFYVAAPFSTFDVTIKTGAEIPIEEREPDEIICGFGKQTAPTGVPVYNPAFDVTPGNLITAIITDRGVVYPPFIENIKKIAGQ